jgi:aconitate hydratase
MWSFWSGDTWDDGGEVSKQKQEFNDILPAKQGFKGFAQPKEKIGVTHKFKLDGEEVELENGSIVVSAITSCTNTSNPDSLVAAGLLAKNAIKKGLKVKPFNKTVLAPGSGVVTKYFEESGLQTYLD